ncbi:hypothetical protein WJX75_006142 [Coccomyxa subellipsoidea]|uniref:Uncharacterized protein n=1 Tax=Coccomyxa subellipsoidea TaxID=248742 RepID=A0ABR2YL48_9CHLO
MEHRMWEIHQARRSGLLGLRANSTGAGTAGTQPGAGVGAQAMLDADTCSAGSSASAGIVASPTSSAGSTAPLGSQGSSADNSGGFSPGDNQLTPASKSAAPGGATSAASNAAAPNGGSTHRMLVLGLRSGNSSVSSY